MAGMSGPVSLTSLTLRIGDSEVYSNPQLAAVQVKTTMVSFAKTCITS